MIKDLSRKLKELRISHNFSQSDVAKQLDVSPSIVSAYETGERTPSVTILIALSDIYKCSIDYLLGKSNDLPPIILDTEGLDHKQIKVLQDLIKVMKHE